MAEAIEALSDEAALSRLQSLIDLFDPIADQAKARPICWLSGGHDASTDYCPDCARWKAKHLRRHDPECREACADGGWDSRRESDHTSFCGGCGHLLGYSLTRYGYGEEMEYWDGDAWIEPVTPVHAYQIRAVLEAAVDYREMLPEALALGERAVLFLPATDALAAVKAGEGSHIQQEPRHG